MKIKLGMKKEVGYCHPAVTKWRELSTQIKLCIKAV